VVLIPKKKRTQKCEEHRTLNLITHASKIIIKIIKNRIDKKNEENLGKDQFGFRKNTGTREAIVTLRVLIEKQIRKNKDTFIAFVDLEKAFDNIKWNILFDILKSIGIKYYDRRCIYNLYKNQNLLIIYI
jgi:hypothetical protein